jgi:glycosyltransferase involved in cell wall biosynthesis/GT2 family glycosyltransferase
LKVCVGIHVHAEPARLLESLAAVERPGRRRHEVLLLPDGPDAMTQRALAGLRRLRQAPTSRPLGAPACFNRLVSESDAEIVILLESGAVPAPGALDRLVVALEREPRAGLASPSTNSAWNEQNVFPGAAGDRAAVERTGREAARRYRRRAQSLAPLYSPADFCLAVRREVVDAIGAADEEYGLGPCWEMDYAARAARAGFDSLWICGAYVWRAPFTARRRRHEERLFEQSRRRYQDGLCGLRLRSARAGYEPHCRGDACEHFAPAQLIRLRRELPARPAAPAPARVPAVPREATPPLVSCVMPTRNRAHFVLHAVRLFQRQDYPSRELIIVDDGDDGLESQLPDDARIRYVRAVRGETIGAKRNRACAAARGAFIAQWDDDDWYGPSRLSAQLAPLLAGRADITGLVTPVFFDLPAWRVWGVTPQLHRRLFVADVHGGTLVFARHVWERLGRYPDASLAEDAAFLARTRARGARLERVDGAGHFVYVRHGRNAWRFALGAHVDRSGWLPVVEPAFPPEDRAFYAAHSPAAAGAPPRSPLVSCLMPTRNRRPFVAQAIGYFLRQDYEQRELVVLDDGDDRVADLMPADPRVRYIPLNEKLVLGEKRNRACELAHGEIAVHWDDDDWHSPNRLTYQLGELERHGAALCGTAKVLYFEPTARRGWLYESPKTQRRWISGLCYRMPLWRENRFAHVQVGEDTRFVCNARIGTPLLLPDHRFFVGVVHAGNTSPKRTTGSNWRVQPLAEIGAVLGSDLAFYETV